MKHLFYLASAIILLLSASCTKNEGEDDPAAPEFTEISCSVTPVSQTGRKDGSAAFTATIICRTKGYVIRSGFEYRKKGGDLVILNCGDSLNPTALASSLEEGSYEFMVFASTYDGKFFCSEYRSFNVHSPESTEVSFTDLKAETSAASSQSSSDGSATVTAKITLTGGTATLKEAGVRYRKTGAASFSEIAGSSSASLSVKIDKLSAGQYEFLAYAKLSDDAEYTSSSSSFSISYPSESRYLWAELPAINDSDNDRIIDTDRTLYYAYHLCAGGEKNAQKNGTARNYTVCYSAEHHCPVWVAAPRHSMYEGSADRTDKYAKDPDIPSSIQYNSKETGGGCNKGHMLGSAERTCSFATNRQVFYYTNIAPQNSSTFNTGGGAWNNLEDYVDSQVCSDTLYVVIGCYFKTYTDRYGNTASPKTISYGGRSDVTCPTMFYYAMLRTKKGNSKKRVQDCSASELQCAAFVMCHTMTKGHEPQAKDIISISELEKLTGFTYFTNVPNAPKTTYTASDWDL